MNNRIRVTSFLLILGLLLVSALPLAAQEDTEDVSPRGERPTIGISFADNDGSAEVTAVVPDGPAAEAGIETGDIITAIDGEAVDADTLATTVWGYEPGDTVTFSLIRDDETLEVSVTLGDPQTGRFGQRRGNMPRIQQLERAFLGIGLNAEAEGAVIDEVAPESAAEAAGLQAGDNITAIDDTPIEAAQDVINTVATYNPGDTITITVERDGDTIELEATLGSRIFGGPIEINVDASNFAFDEETNTWEVLDVTEGSPAAEAGLQAGDVITEINGDAFTADTVIDLMALMDPATTITLTVERDGETVELEAQSVLVISLLATSQGPVLRFEERLPFEFRGPGNNLPFEFRGPDGDRFEFRGPNRERFEFRPGRFVLGVAYTTLTAEIAEENGLDVTDGALITDVLPDTPAAEAGLQVGDIVISVSDDVLDEERTLPDRLFAYEPGDTITLEVLRDGETLEIDVTLSQTPAIPVVPPTPEPEPVPEIENNA